MVSLNKILGEIEAIFILDKNRALLNAAILPQDVSNSNATV